MKGFRLWLVTGAVTIMSLMIMAQSAFGCSWGSGEIKVPKTMIR